MQFCKFYECDETTTNNFHSRRWNICELHGSFTNNFATKKLPRKRVGHFVPDFRLTLHLIDMTRVCVTLVSISSAGVVAVRIRLKWERLQVEFAVFHVPVGGRCLMTTPTLVTQNGSSLYVGNVSNAKRKSIQKILPEPKK